MINLKSMESKIHCLKTNSDFGMNQNTFEQSVHGRSVTRKKSPNVYKSCPKNDFTRKMIDFDNFTKNP